MTQVTSTEHIWIPMPDGTRLAARLWLPEGIAPGGIPAIFEYIPYRKTDMVRARDERNHPYFAAHGYACLRVDMRGSGDSDGVMPDMYDRAELEDARHVIGWIAAQDWCNGHVGMFGTSWGGTASLQACVDAPGPLKAVIAVCATHDRYEDDIHHMGGCLLTDTFEWGATLPTILALPPSPASGADWKERWIARLEEARFPVENWVREEARGAYWRHGSTIWQADRFGCPVLAVGGWSDRYSNSVMALTDACPGKVWGIVGPWGHHYPDHGHPGPAIGFQQVALEWWDRWLKPGTEAADWPRLRVWLREFDAPGDALDRRNGSWVASGPAAQVARRQVFHAAPDGVLGDAAPQSGAGWDVPLDLSHGRAAGDTGYFGRFGGLPLEQSEDDSRALLFDSAPLEEDMILYGAAEAVMTVAPGQERGQICLRLCDVAPDGRSARVGFAIRNLALDAALDAPAAPQGTGPRSIHIRFPTNAYRLRAGHRLRLAVAQSYWPLVWIPPQVGTLRLSDLRLDLPVWPDPAALREAFPEPLDLPEDRMHEVLAAPDLSRLRSTRPDGTQAIKWHQPPVITWFEETGAVFSYETVSDHRVHPGDPESAESLFTHRMTLDRPDGTAEVAARLRTTCTQDAFVLEGRLEVQWEDETLLDRSWTRQVARRYS